METDRSCSTPTNDASLVTILLLIMLCLVCASSAVNSELQLRTSTQPHNTSQRQKHYTWLHAYDMYTVPIPTLALYPPLQRTRQSKLKRDVFSHKGNRLVWNFQHMLASPFVRSMVSTHSFAAKPCWDTTCLDHQTQTGVNHVRIPVHVKVSLLHQGHILTSNSTCFALTKS